MRRTGWLWDERFLDHVTGPSHPERPDRLRAMRRGVESAGLPDRLVPIAATPASDADLQRVHSAGYIARLQRACDSGERYIDVQDSAICPHSERIARLAVGGILAACDALAAGTIDNAFCAVRPPGHHARKERSAGFCLYNNVALAARHLQARHGIPRVMILDWDVHHGDGTQEVFWRDPSVLFISLHEDPRYCYPGTGFVNEVGEGPGRGTTLNLPMPVAAEDGRYQIAFCDEVLPAAHAFKPDVLLVSNGFDAHAADPLAGVCLSDDGFVWLMQQAVHLARELCGGRLLATLEGGYELGVLERCVPRQLETMLRD